MFLLTPCTNFYTVMLCAFVFVLLLARTEVRKAGMF